MHEPTEVAETGPWSSSSPASSSRWNPTKEHISLLERLYKQGVRTPSAEQIQQITGKLREFGSIEGKNVFYWFQNHKARQRQKEKQENFAYFSRLLDHHHHPPAPIPPPLAPPSSCNDNNAACTPYYVPVSHVGCVGFLPPHLPAMLSPTTAVVGESSYFPKTAHFSEFKGEMGRRRSSTDHRRERCYGTAVDVHHGQGRDCSQETLQLFPLHPTGFSEERRRSESGGTPTSASTEEEIKRSHDGRRRRAKTCLGYWKVAESNVEPPRGMKTP